MENRVAVGSGAGTAARIALYTAVVMTGLTFSVLFESGEGVSWLFFGAALAALCTASTGRHRFALLAPAIILYTLLVIYGLPPVSIGGWQSLFLEVRNDVYQAAEIMYLQPVPYDYRPGLLVILLPVVMLVSAFATSATLYEKSPVFSIVTLGLTIGVISTVSFETGVGPYFALFIISSVFLILFTGSFRFMEDVGWPGVAAVAGITLLGLTLTLDPLKDVAIRPALVDWTEIGTGGTSHLDVQADVGSYLDSGRDTELLRVRSQEPLLWRGGTLDYFDGVRWSSTVEPGADDGEEIASGVETRVVRQRFRVLNAETNLVFGGYQISNTSLPEADRRSDGSWAVDENLSKGRFYEIISEVPQPTTGQLQTSGTSYPAAVREKFLQIPQSTPRVVGETADVIEREYSPDTPYETARAIERYLVYDGGFAYNLDANFRRGDRAIERFLGDEREGFCTQFATSMALVSREMGVPARVVYGASSGEKLDTNEYLVTGRNMHTWVEVYFPGVGWYPFDPTPGFSVPQTMQQNAARIEPSGDGRQDLIPGSPAYRDEISNSPAGESELRDTATGGTSGPREGTPAWPLYIFAPALLLVAIPLSKRSLRFWRWPENLYRDLIARLSDVLPPGKSSGLAGSPSLTPTEKLLLLSGAAGVEEESFRDFARAYSDHLYSGKPRAETRTRVTRAYDRAVESLDNLPRWRRVLGALNPGSLMLRLQKSLAVSKKKVQKTARTVFGGVVRWLSRRLSRRLPGRSSAKKRR